MPTPANSHARILCIDDEPNLLAGLKRQFHSKFEVVTAESGAEGLAIIQTQAPFSVIVSDMRMPGMSGAAFLSKAKQLSPNSIRILLTGQADIDSAIIAVNEGQIFRFLVKPCPPQIFSNIIDSAVEQYQLVTLEKDLLEQTLYGSLKVLIDMLSLVNPVAFSQSSRVQAYVNHMAINLHTDDKWQYEIAAMLSQIGCIIVPQEILTKVHSLRPLTLEENKIYQSHPMTGYNLILKIPRLENVAGMVKNQRSANTLPAKLTQDCNTELLGGNMLRIALDVDRRLSAGQTLHSALNSLGQNPQAYHPELLRLLSDFKGLEFRNIHKAVYIRDLTISMKIDEDIQTTTGTVIVSKGQDVTEVMLARLRAMSNSHQIREPFRVVVCQ